MIDELDLIRASMDDVSSPSEEVVARLRDSLDALIASDTQALARLERTSRNRRRAMRIGIGSVAAAGILTAALLLPASSGGPSAAAASVLRHEAEIAGDQPSTTPIGPGQFMYTSFTGTELAIRGFGGPQPPGSPPATGPSHSFSVLLPVTDQMWMAADGSGRHLQTHGAPTFLSAADRSAWLADGSPPILAPHVYSQDTLMGKGQLSGYDLSALPTDPAALLGVLNQRTVESGPPGNAETFTIIGDLLSQSDASPALRSALYAVAAGLPGVELVGTTTDGAGRSGTAVAYTSRGERYELIFDPSTSALLGTETVVTDPSQLRGLNVSVGTVIETGTYGESGVVGSDTATPSGASIPLSATMTPTPLTPTGFSNPGN